MYNGAATVIIICILLAFRGRQHRQEEGFHDGLMNNVDNQEFKILRSSFANIFDDRSRLDSILQEEGRAGWKLVEKLDITLATIAGIGAGFIILRVMLPEVF